MTVRTVARLENVSKRLGPTLALDAFNLSIPEGEFVALLGPNGAGKTTAHNILLGLRRPDTGTARLFERDPRHPGSRRLIGVAPQSIGIPVQLKVWEAIDLVRAHFPEPYAASDLLGMFGLGRIASRQVGGLSGGETRRLAVALAFAGRPRALFLDEPTTGVDVEARRNLWAVLTGFVAAGGTILMSTHYLEEAEALASRVAIIDKGRLIAEGSVANMKARVGLKRVSFHASRPPLVGEGSVVTREGDRYSITARDSDRAIREIVRSCDFSDLTVQPVSLEEAFRWLLQEQR